MRYGVPIHPSHRSGAEDTYNVRSDLPAGNSVHLNHDGGIGEVAGDEVCVMKAQWQWQWQWQWQMFN
jgi:hypothetical protein